MSYVSELFPVGIEFSIATVRFANISALFGQDAEYLCQCLLLLLDRPLQSR